MSTEYKLSYTASEIDEKLKYIDTIQNSGGNVDLTGYAKEQWVQQNYQPKGEYLTEVPDGYAKTSDIPTKPEDIDAQPAGNYALKSEIPSVPVLSVNNKTGAVTLSASDVGARPDNWMPSAQEVGALPSNYTPPNQTAEQVGADPKGTAASAVSQHNTADDSHNDIRMELKAINDRLTAFFDSDNQTLDELSEIVAYITSNKSLIDSITTSKVSVADIVNDLTSNITNKPLSAAQGVVLKGLIDAVSNSLVNYQPVGDYALKSQIPTVPTKVSAFENDKGYLTQHQDISGKLDASELPTAINTALGYTPASLEDVEIERSRIDSIAEIMVTTESEELVQDNIWNPDTAEAGLLYPAEGGIMKDSTNWMTSPFEFAKPDQIYTCYSRAHDNYRINNPCWCAYDKDKNFISGQAMATHHTFTTPVGTCYVRVSTSNGNLNTLFITPGYESDYGVYKPYKNEWVKKVAPNFVTKKEFEESKEVIANSVSVTNLFSTDAFAAFQYNYSNSTYQGATETEANLASLGVSRATVHAKFTFAPGRYLAMARAKCTQFDSGGNTQLYLGTNGRNTELANQMHVVDTYYGCQYNGYSVGNAKNQSDGTLQVNTYYTLGILLDITETDTFNIDFAMLGDNKDGVFVYKDLMVLEIGDYLERADAMDILVNADFIAETAELTYSYKNPGGLMAGKTLAVIGDSITAGVKTDNSENHVKNTYGYMIAADMGMKFMNFGMGGTTITAFSGKKFCLSEEGGRIAHIPAPDIDICLIMMGFNDFNTSGFSVGTIDDTANTTFYGAYNAVLSNLIARNPKMKIGLITPYGTDKTVRDAVKAVGKKYAAPVLDLYSDSIPMFYERDTMTTTLTNIANSRKPILLADGVHPNTDGHKFLSTIIGHFVESLTDINFSNIVEAVKSALPTLTITGVDNDGTTHNWTVYGV